MSTTNNNFLNPETGKISITEAYGVNLASLLAGKISAVYKPFDSIAFVQAAGNAVIGKKYTERVEILADLFRRYLPNSYLEALTVLLQILGPENKAETGMFRDFYWLMPVGKFIEEYGLDHFPQSIAAIGELTKRNTGEYAIRVYARKYPEETLAICQEWAQSPNFHLRRLASEGLRPKLPWATKLDIWNQNPEPVLAILELLKTDEIKFVKKSVANHLRDWLKVNPQAAETVIKTWSKSKNPNTQWILKHAQR